MRSKAACIDKRGELCGYVDDNVARAIAGERVHELLDARLDRQRRRRDVDAARIGPREIEQLVEQAGQQLGVLQQDLMERRDLVGLERPGTARERLGDLVDRGGRSPQLV